MLIPNTFLHIVVYIFPNVADAEAGNGTNGGATGFLLTVPRGGKDFLFVVTNAHVLEYLEKMGADECVMRVNTTDGKTKNITLKLSNWGKHPDGDDVAICSIAPEADWRYSSITEDMLLREDYVHKDIFSETEGAPVSEVDIEDDGTMRKWNEVHKVGIGTETIMVGRFIKHGGVKMNYHVVRRGHIAMLPFEPITQAGRDGAHDAFLVETYSIGGFSGSPVFIQTSVNPRRKAHDGTSNGTTYKERVFLLGVDAGHFDFDGQVISSDVSADSFKVPSGMMCVVPAWKLSEVINSDRVSRSLDRAVEDHRAS